MVHLARNPGYGYRQRTEAARHVSPIKQKVLVLFAHPAQRGSEVNVPMLKVAEWVTGVTVVDLYAEYPVLDIDIDAEQARLREHDVIVFAFPMYWYSTPAILKEWQDQVLEYGFAYGSEGTALHGKTFFAATTTGGPEEAYRTEGYNHFTVRQLFAPLEQTASLCGMTYLPPLILHRARSAKELRTVDPHLEAWEHLLEALVHGSLDMAAARNADSLNALAYTLTPEH